MSQQRDQHDQDSVPNLMYYLDELEDMVTAGKRVPMSRKVMVDEAEFGELADLIRATIPIEIRDAQRLIKERERIIGEAQDRALRIVNDAQRHAQLLVSDHTIMAEAKQHAENMLRQAERERQAARGEMEVFFLQQLKAMRDAALQTMSLMESTVEQTLTELDRAESAITDPADTQG